MSHISTAAGFWFHRYQLKWKLPNAQSFCAYKHKCFASNLHLTTTFVTTVASKSHQSSWKKTDGHRERERCHETIPQGRSHRQLLDEIFEEGNLLKGSTVSNAKGDRFKKISFFQDKFRPLPLQPFSSSTVSIFYPAFLHRTAVSVRLYLSVCICPSPKCLSWQWIGWRPPLAWNPKKSERSQNSHRVPRLTDGQGSQPSLAIKPPVDRVVSLHGYHPQASGNHGSFACLAEGEQIPKKVLC